MSNQVRETRNDGVDFGYVANAIFICHRWYALVAIAKGGILLFVSIGNGIFSVPTFYLCSMCNLLSEYAIGTTVFQGCCLAVVRRHVSCIVCVTLVLRIRDIRCC